MNKGNLLVGMVLVLLGIAIIPITIVYTSLFHVSVLLILVSIIISMAPISSGLFIIYVGKEIQNPAQDTITNDNTVGVDNTVNVADKNASVHRHIIITISDGGLSLETAGLSPQETIGFLEVAKHYVIVKSVGMGSVIDTVKRT
jgi:hypothetical protein